MVREIEEIDYDKMDYLKFNGRRDKEKAINIFLGFLYGIKSDDVISDDEKAEMLNWVSLYWPFLYKSRYKSIFCNIRYNFPEKEISIDDIDLIIDSIIKIRVEHKTSFRDDNTRDIQVFQGYIYGLMADNTINAKECESLKFWLQQNSHLKTLYPYDEVVSLLIGVLKDGIVEESEENILKAYFSDFIDIKNSYNINQVEIEILKKKYNVSGICSSCPKIDFENNSFCFTGKSDKATRDEISEIITGYGGLFHKNVLKTTQYLVVGNEGNPCWAYSCYGRKVEKAVELRKLGNNIVIVHEYDFWSNIS